MKDYTRTYIIGMLYDDTLSFEDQFIPCEVCDKKAVDVHHLEARGMGGTTAEYTARVLMGLCRSCHEEYGDKKQFYLLLTVIHRMRYYLRKIHRIISFIYPS